MRTPLDRRALLITPALACAGGLLLWLAGERAAVRSRHRPAGVPGAATLEDPDDAPRRPPRRGRFMRSGRCGECHERLYKEWQASAHAQATRSAAYRQALDHLDDEGRRLCQGCHLPGLAYGQQQDTPERPSEGVSCDGCHTMQRVATADDGARAFPVYDVASGRKYGPLYAPESNYYHGMAHSPLHQRAEICAACHHLLSFTLAGQARKIPVVTDYDGWRRHEDGDHAQPCQDCHMPSRGSEPVARGARIRADVPAHTFAGAATLGKQLKLELSADPRAGTLTVEIAHAAGHPVPSGFVDRRLLVRVSFQDRDGKEVGTAERSYGIFLEDAAGHPAPFFLAARVAEDRRMIPGQTYTLNFDLPTPLGHPARAVVSLWAAPTAPELAAWYGPPALAPLRSATVVFHEAGGQK